MTRTPTPVPVPSSLDLVVDLVVDTEVEPIGRLWSMTPLAGGSGWPSSRFRAADLPQALDRAEQRARQEAGFRLRATGRTRYDVEVAVEEVDGTQAATCSFTVER